MNVDYLDLFTRIALFIEDAGALGVLGLLLAILALLVIAVTRRQGLLVQAYLLALMFSGFTVPAIDSGSTLFRWGVLVALGASGLFGWRNPGLPAMMVAGLGVFGAATVGFSPRPQYGFQFGVGLILMTGLAGGVIARNFPGIGGVRKLVGYFRVVAVVYAVLAVSALPTMRQGGRFSGLISSAPLFVMSGGILLPILLWSWLDRGRTDAARRRSGALALAILALMLLSGQRAGLYAGAIGSVPLIVNARLGRAVRALVGLGVLGIGFLFVQSRLSTQVEFVTSRYESTDTTGRAERWDRALSLCLSDPITPAGFGALTVVGFGFHNAFLAAWFEGGVLGLLLFPGACLVLIFSYLSVIRSRAPTEVQDLGRLFLGLTLALIAGAFFEVKLYSPSNILIFTLTILSIAIRPLRAWRHGLVPGTAPQVGEPQPGQWAGSPAAGWGERIR